MSLFFLPLAVLLGLVVLLVVLLGILYRALRAAARIAHARFEVTPMGSADTAHAGSLGTITVAPGEGMKVVAHVVPRGRSPISLRASLRCTMLDHRTRVLYESAQQLTPIFGRQNEFAGYLTMPAYALRSGAVGDELSKLFSEDAHRLLVFWSVEIEILSSNGSVLVDESIPIEVPAGRPLEADRAYMERLIVETCGAMHSDLVFNWLVRLSLADGHIEPRERSLLHEVLRAGHGISDPGLADARIAAESKRELQIDAHVLRKHLSSDRLAVLYRFLYAMAWRDGHLDNREHAFLLSVLSQFGLDGDLVRSVERDVLQGMAAHAIRP